MVCQKGEKKVKKKALYKKWMSMLLAGVVTTTGFMGGTVTLRAAETTNWIGDEGLSGTADAPKPDDVVPDANQFRYQKEELAAFCHFGPNTFNEIEWGEHYGNKAPSEIFTLKNDFDAETLVKTLKDAGFKKLIVTAKHHDGFCIWDSKYTDYDVKESGYKDKNRRIRYSGRDIQSMYRSEYGYGIISVSVGYS